MKSCGVDNQKNIQELIVKTVMSLFEKATTQIKVGSGYSHKFYERVVYI